MLHRVIHRWDFPTSFEIFDRPGAAIKALIGEHPTAWDGLNDNVTERTYTLRSRDSDGRFQKSFSFSPVTAVFSIEWREGVELDRWSHLPDLNELFQMMEQLDKLGSLSTLNRCGIRLYYLGAANTLPKAESKVSPIDHFQNERCSPLAVNIEKVLGKAGDSMLVLRGEAEDETKYSVRVGPYFAGEYRNHFEYVEPEESQNFDRNFICDVDFYEQSFKRTVSPKKWASSSFIKMSELIQKFPTYLNWQPS